MTSISSLTPPILTDQKKTQKTTYRIFVVFIIHKTTTKNTSQIHVSATKGFSLTSNIPQPLFNTTDDQTVRRFSSSQNKKKTPAEYIYEKENIYIEDGYGHGEKIKSKLLSLT